GSGSDGDEAFDNRFLSRSEARQAMANDNDSESPWANARIRTPEQARKQQGPRRAAPVSPRRAEDSRQTNHQTPTQGAGEFTDAIHPSHANARESRLYGLNACLAAFAKRPDSLRKVYLTEARIPALKNVLAWCVKNRLGYRVVEESDLDKLTSSRHHEGVCFDMLRAAPLELDALLANVPKAPARSLLLWLDGVGNPHNVGALLRTAAHFGVHGVISPQGFDVSGAAARVAEGAAEIVPFVQARSAVDALAALRMHGYALAATMPRASVPLYATALPERLVLVFGAEGEGMSEAMVAAADLRLMIPGSGTIESLNVAASVAVVLGEFWRQHARDA
ncbi:MAG: TrmH family RNA methyltransferase, partial [Dokdonella sp.]|uniref:TrmH family RNA methyltransferase n=1 Tax=Dokdonella sp. TaxID=2291710 RepID=UPI003265AE0B